MEWIPRAKHPSNPLTSQVGKQPIPDKNGRACLPSAHACSPASHPGVTHNRSSRRSTERGRKQLGREQWRREMGQGENSLL